ncbi:integrase catalytic domain-containing protein [Streptomyces sp. NPDC001118]
MHGPKIGGRKTYLFAFIDDHSRAIVGHRFGFAEDTVRLAAALRPALSARGVPESILWDTSHVPRRPADRPAGRALPDQGHWRVLHPHE